MRQESIRILEENIGSNLFDISHRNFFQHMSPKAKKTNAKMNFWDFIKIKSSCTAENMELEIIYGKSWGINKSHTNTQKNIMALTSYLFIVTLNVNEINGQSKGTGYRIG